MKFEPVLILDAVKYVLLALAGTGVLVLDDATQQWVIGVAGAVLAVYTTWETRKRVTPVAKLDGR
ncbi:hypothetical protein AB1484_29280 [Parafrankia sp. FMc6]|uniref:hypothetical protein n=1 Tax=Parafrankia soli TaxID=2599596 RepID=UPI0034D64279